MFRLTKSFKDLNIGHSIQKSILDLIPALLVIILKCCTFHPVDTDERFSYFNGRIILSLISQKIGKVTYILFKPVARTANNEFQIT